MAGDDCVVHEGSQVHSTCTWLCYFSRIAVATTQRSHNVAPKLDAEPMNRWTDESMNRWSDESMKRWIDESMKRWLFFGSHIIFNIKFLGEQKWKIDTIFIKIIVSAQIGGLAGHHCIPSMAEEDRHPRSKQQGHWVTWRFFAFSFYFVETKCRPALRPSTSVVIHKVGPAAIGHQKSVVRIFLPDR